ncbi:MAG TPA: PaaI family thioesterase [Actinomadura sp.]|nr:PaaI family thioesterase [Actinomadura sp.]
MEPPEHVAGFEKVLGIEHVELTADRVVLTCEITPDLLQPYGILHGGVHCSLVETAASYGAAVWFGDRGHVVGVANHTNFLRAARSGLLRVVATPVHRGRTQQLWQVAITDETGRDVARGEVRLANIASADGLGRDGGSERS